MPRGIFPRPTVAERFWPKVDVRGEGECHPWIGVKFQSGMHYGMFNLDRKPRHAHRVAWALVNGPIPNGLLVLHHCDNPICCNVRHLFLGTHTDNMKDMGSKRRGRLQRPFNLARGDRHGSRLHPESRPRGEAHSRTHLTTKMVLEMRRLHREGTPQVELGRTYGLKKDVVSKIVKRVTWRHLP